jgi:hypothetical protein
MIAYGRWLRVSHPGSWLRVRQRPFTNPIADFLQGRDGREDRCANRRDVLGFRGLVLLNREISAVPLVVTMGLGTNLHSRAGPQPRGDAALWQRAAASRQVVGLPCSASDCGRTHYCANRRLGLVASAAPIAPTLACRSDSSNDDAHSRIRFAAFQHVLHFPPAFGQRATRPRSSFGLTQAGKCS